MVKNSRFAVLVALFVMLHAGVAMAQDWPEFLGEGGVARSDDKIPTTWNEKENLLWKLDLPGVGSSSPIVVGNNVFVTCFRESSRSFSRDSDNVGWHMEDKVSIHASVKDATSISF